jgi:hypothetical protein
VNEAGPIQARLIRRQQGQVTHRSIGRFQRGVQHLKQPSRKRLDLVVAEMARVEDDVELRRLVVMDLPYVQHERVRQMLVR